MASPIGLATSAHLPTCENGQGRSVQKFTGGVGHNRKVLGGLGARAMTRCERRALLTLHCRPMRTSLLGTEPRALTLSGTAVTHKDPERKRTTRHFVHRISPRTSRQILFQVLVLRQDYPTVSSGWDGLRVSERLLLCSRVLESQTRFPTHPLTWVLFNF